MKRIVLALSIVAIAACSESVTGPAPDLSILPPLSEVTPDHIGPPFSNIEPEPIVELTGKFSFGDFSMAAMQAGPTVGHGTRAAVGSLRVALEALPGGCVTLPGDVYDLLGSLLTARGHTVTIVSGADIDTPAEIDAFDVVAFGGGAFNCGWDWLTFDAQLRPFVERGGGLVVTGWAAYYMTSNPRGETFPGLASALPVLRGTQYAVSSSVDAVPGHEITDGLGAFGPVQYVNYGSGLRPGATPLLRVGATPAGAAWELGDGRSVYLGPVYLANFSGYDNEPLLDGTWPDALELFLRAIEWAGRPSGPQTKDDCKKGGWDQYGFKNQGQCVRFVETGKDSREG